VDHTWEIEEREYARQEQRRGRRHAFTRLEPAHTALVVVDTVPRPDDPPYAAGIVPRINKLASALRSRGGTVAWAVPGRGQARAVDTEFHGTALAGLQAGDGPVRDRLWPDLEPHDADTYTQKTAASAFFPGRSDLDGWLQIEGVETVLVAGMEEGAVATVRDAFTLGYRPILVADAVAAESDALLVAALRSVYRSYGDVRSTEDVLALIG
jgi:nicotinamidase-related amidase